MVKAVDRGRAQIDAEIFRLHHQGIDQIPVLDHVREGFARFNLAAETQKSLPYRVVEF